ncbi:diaminopimelate epimerase [Legionella geestiana]|uniref:diaminopimelate epimerase n=1 Tax=Legionella geestiana TaxID=45065 RepID=UPI0010929C05|nr:diaminopimelate epimerase [Legionella geestiana]QDQ39290.1 diaminopimelate epimerase [Legionella geestiana]
MKQRFTKMHGLGNDFMVIDSVTTAVNLSSLPVAALARRDTGVGFDQLLVVEPSKTRGIDFYYRIFNANGEEVGQCGNGARCLARFIRHYGLSDKSVLTVATHTTRMTLRLNPDDTVTVDMGIPRFLPAEIPLLMPKMDDTYRLPLEEANFVDVHALSVGNPHAVLAVEDVAKAAVETLGARISTHPLFPEGTNAGFMERVSSTLLRLRVFERGSMETKACGSGAAAAAVVGRRFYDMQSDITVELPGGRLNIHWEGLEHPLLLTGPAAFVYEGVLF